ncbi:MAG: DUF1573 domain-containing protein [Bacteroidales bacterium]|nr:DUF1573 domain-containing protein [Bacteroidales bacterium]
MKRIFFVVAIMLIAGMAFSQENAPKKEKKEKAQTEKVEKRSSILFDKLVHDFGTMEKGGDASCVFTFKNVTKKPVTLTNVKTSCGCTAADWPKEPIAKKKKGSIRVKYDSNRIGKFTKTIKVYIDGEENPIQLEIKGTIVSTNANDVKAAPVEKKIEAVDKKVEKANPQLNEIKREEVKSDKK